MGREQCPGVLTYVSDMIFRKSKSSCVLAKESVLMCNFFPHKRLTEVWRSIHHILQGTNHLYWNSVITQDLECVGIWRQIILLYTVSSYSLWEVTDCKDAIGYLSSRSSLSFAPKVLKKVKVLLSHVWHFVTPWTVACQAPLFTEFSRQEYWSG